MSQSTHPSPHFPTVQAHCLSFPNAVEDYPWGDIVYKIKGKLFAATGRSLPLQVTVKAEPADADSLIQQPFIERAAYVGRYGWVTVTVEDPETLNLLLGLIEVSYDLVRGKRTKQTNRQTGK